MQMPVSGSFSPGSWQWVGAAGVPGGRSAAWGGIPHGKGEWVRRWRVQAPQGRAREKGLDFFLLGAAGLEIRWGKMCFFWELK